MLTTKNNMEYSIMSQPPPVPEYWHWSGLKLTSNGPPLEFRDAIFAKANEAKVHIGIKSPWWYIFESVTPRYILAECRFFKHRTCTHADINLLEGDRFAWAFISRHLCGDPVRKMYTRPTIKSIRTDKRLEAMVEPDMDEDIFDLIGSDFLPAKLMSVLMSASPNIKRCALRALYHCDVFVDKTVIEPYCQGGVTFLEKRIQYWAKKIVQKKNKSFL